MNINNKELTMNKLTKYGVSALCGSLAAISTANAGDLRVTGGVDMSWISLDDETTGNPLGIGSNLTFKGSGELDNGWTFNLTIAEGDASAYSATTIDMTMGGFGTIEFDQGNSGNGIAAYDNVMPTAWEETTGTSLGTGLQTVAGVAGHANIDWNISPDMLPDGFTAALAFTPKAGGLGANDKASTGSSNEAMGAGYDIALSYSGYEGINIFGGYSNIEQATEDFLDDRTQYVLGATYAVGMVTVGYQWSRDNLNDRNDGSVEQYLSALEGLFISQSGQEMSRVKFNISKQDKGESMTLWATRLKCLYRIAFPEDQAIDFNLNVKDRFIAGMNDIN